MNAEILCVGTELLLGDVVNTNATHIAKGLAQLGVNVYHQSVVGDNAGRLKQALCEAFERSDLVILTGGLGPTYDDLTKETVAAYFGRPMEMRKDCRAAIEGYFKKTGRVMTKNNRKQAMMPKDAIVLPNAYGTAPGCIVEGGGKAAILMPGPPREMKQMFDGPVTEYLSRHSQGVLVSRSVNIFGVGESAVEERLRDTLMKSEDPTVAPYAKASEVLLRVTTRAETKEEGYRKIGPVVSQILEIFPDNVYGLDCGSIEEAAVGYLKAFGLTAAAAESCTGGLVAKRITDLPGASEVFGLGVCAYANEMKEAVLGVRHETLLKHGAVSRETALEMARGVRAVSGADIGVSTTGIAGPGGGTGGKPVGLVYVAAVSAAGEEVLELHLSREREDDRENIRLMASSYALSLVIRMARQCKRGQKEEGDAGKSTRRA